MADFSHQNFRFKNGGLKTNSVPDAMPDGKYPYLQNVRGYNDDEMQSRPPFKQFIANPVTPGAVDSLEPTIGVYKIGGNLLVNGAVVDSGYSPTEGASLVPFRPSSSPDPWEYVFDDLKSSKVRVPLIGSPTVKKTGLEEPQSPLEASVSNQFQVFLDKAASGWTAGGTAFPPIDGQRVADTVGAVFIDPASGGGRMSFQVSPSQQYAKFMVLIIHGELYIVDDVFPNLTTPISILAVRYFSGTTGRCVVVPNNLAAAEPSLFTQLLLTSIRRGAIVSLGGELCYVLSSSTGPDGSLCFETTTTLTHGAGESLIVADALSVIGSGLAPGMLISSPRIQASVGTGIGTLTQHLSSSPFINGQSSFQPDDYIHISIKHGDLQNINEIKILFDIGDGTFTQNFCYYSIRASDLADSVNNVQTQLAAAQIIEQRAIIDQEKIALAHNQGRSSSSAQLGPGKDQWSEIVFPISALTRVGGDENLSLQNANALQILYNVSGNIITKVNGITIFGGFQSDVGDSGMPYQYWLVPRDSETGAKGNPTPAMRYGVMPRRQWVYIPLPLTAPDVEADTWDVFRMGGALDKPRYLGSQPVGTTVFIDSFSDATIANNRAMEGDNYEPFPSIGPPLLPANIISSSIVGTRMIITFAGFASTNPSIQQFDKLLPGNEFNIGDQVFTLWTRPILLSSTLSSQTWLVEFVENAGVLSNPLIQLNEPTLASQANQCVWGPDSNGVFFAVQDPLRPGVISRTKPNNPDSAPEASTDELCPPSEPLQNGVLQNQTAIVFSPNRAWAGYPGQVGYRWNEIPVGAGLAAPFGLCTDGRRTYFVAKDGIRATTGGPSESLTDADLYNLFPHEGLFPGPVSTIAGLIYPPDYTYAHQFRLSVINGYLYFDYIATVGLLHAPKTLVCDLRMIAWSIDASGFNPQTIHAGATLPGTGTGGKKQQLYAGDSVGGIYVEDSSPTPGAGEQVACIVATREFMNDLRAKTMFGDGSLDCLAGGGSIAVNPVSLKTAVAVATAVAPSATRQNIVLNLQGQQIIRSLGFLLQWTDQGQTTILYSWGTSTIPQPEDTANRFSDWDDGGIVDAKFFQGFEIEFDSFDVNKRFVVRDADSLSLHTFSSSLGSNVVKANGQTVQAFSFDAGFVAHSVRIEPDSGAWRMFRIKWVFQPTPESVLTWETQGTSFGLNGYVHAKEVLAAYSSTAPVDLTVTTFDGNDPQVIALPSTGGKYQKAKFTFTPNKGLLYFFKGVSSSEWRPFLRDWEIKVKEWGSGDPYVIFKNIGGDHGDQARI